MQFIYLLLVYNYCIESKETFWLLAARSFCHVLLAYAYDGQVPLQQFKKALGCSLCLVVTYHTFYLYYGDITNNCGISPISKKWESSMGVCQVLRFFVGGSNHGDTIKIVKYRPHVLKNWILIDNKTEMYQL